MKTRKHIREELNLTQQEMAMLLNISRSQWALYELGLRDLSIMASIRENQASRFLDSLGISEPKHFPGISEIESKKDKFVADALKENEFNQRVCERKIGQMKKNYESALKFFHVVDFVFQSVDQENAIHLAALKVLKGNAETALNKNGPHKLLKLQLRQKMLEQEKLLLTEWLK